MGAEEGKGEEGGALKTYPWRRAATATVRKVKDCILACVGD